MEPTSKFILCQVQEKGHVQYFLPPSILAFVKDVYFNWIHKKKCLLQTNITSWHKIKHSLDLKPARESLENALALRRTNFGQIDSSPTESWSNKIKKYIYIASWIWAVPDPNRPQIISDHAARSYQRGVRPARQWISMSNILEWACLFVCSSFGVHPIHLSERGHL